MYQMGPNTRCAIIGNPNRGSCTQDDPYMIYEYGVIICNFVCFTKKKSNVAVDRIPIYDWTIKSWPVAINPSWCSWLCDGLQQDAVCDARERLLEWPLTALVQHLLRQVTICVSPEPYGLDVVASLHRKWPFRSLQGSAAVAVVILLI